MKVSIVGSLRDREVACSASDRQGSNFESCVWRTVSSQSSHHPQEVLLAQFSLYVHKGGLKPDSFHLFKRLAHSENLRKANPKNLIQISTTPTFDAQISCCLINARSVCSKNDIILDYIISNDIDLAVITETWLGEGANFDNVIGSLSPPGYTLVHSPRHGKRGGGIAFLHKIGLALTTRKCTKYATFECFEAVITNKTSSICLVAVYCPGKH